MKRVTIMLEDALDKKLRVIQAKRILKGTSCSFSKCLNDTLRETLK